MPSREQLEGAAEVQKRLANLSPYASKDECIAALRRIANDLARELLASRWRPITETDLPTMRDEVGRWLSDGRFETGSVGATADFSVWRDRRWTHFRPKSPPARTDKGEA